jgi:type III restriction enzyme
MPDQFFTQPILNSPYEYPSRHWELDEHGQPTQKIVDRRRRADFVTPIPKPRRRQGAPTQQILVMDDEILEGTKS